MPPSFACFSRCFRPDFEVPSHISAANSSDGGYSPVGAHEAGDSPVVGRNLRSLDSARISDVSTKLNRNAALDDRLYVHFHEVLMREKIGSGSFKTVFRGLWHSTQVAVVRMKRGGLVADARVMQRLSNHPNLTQFYRWTRDSCGREYVIMELLPSGSLDKLLLQRGADFKTKAKMHICIQVCTAMAALIKENIIHRDLAARNVLVQAIDPVHVKVADFGLARNLPSGDSNSNWTSELQSLPVRWVPPEVIRESKWSEKSDVWAFGITMWEIFSNGREPYAECSNDEVITKVLAGYRLPRPSRCPPEVYKLMLNCWQEDASQRPTFEEIQTYFQEWRQNRRKELEMKERQPRCCVSEEWDVWSQDVMASRKLAGLGGDAPASLPGTPPSFTSQGERYDQFKGSNAIVLAAHCV